MISLREKTCRAFSYESIAAATLNFSPANKLGEGGYGEVFKGRLEDGRMVAVKRLGVGSKQGEKEFKVEAKLLSQLQHRNIVNLYGYCLHQEEKMLVYEFVRNQSLDKFLFSVFMVSEKGSFMACNFSTVSLAFPPARFVSSSELLLLQQCIRDQDRGVASFAPVKPNNSLRAPGEVEGSSISPPI